MDVISSLYSWQAAQAVNPDRPQDVVNDIQFHPSREWYALWIACQGVGPVEEGIEDVYIGGFRSVHEAWENLADDLRADLKHPLAALIEGWLLQPESIRPDVDRHGRPRTKGILPGGLLPKQPAQLALIPDRHKGQLPGIGRIERAERQLPLFAELMVDNDLPVTPLILADAAGFRGLQPGRGARYDKRLLVFGLLSMPRDQRRPGARYEWRPTLREIRDLLWPARPVQRRGKTRSVTSYRPIKHAWSLLSALQAVNLAEIGLPDGDTWRPMRVWRNPDLDNLDRQAIIEIRLPGESDHGPLVDKSALAAAGVISDPAFDLELGLAYLWDDAKARNGGYRIRATRPEALRNEHGHIVDAARQVVLERGRPATRWDHPQAVLTGRQERHPQADKVRVLTREERRRLSYGPANDKHPNQLTSERRQTDRLLAERETAGRIVIERNAINPRTGQKGWRILEAWPKE
ncbi:MAG: hypothetical protein OXK74_01475 [Gemmatimonadota bacterium]|nr:hypothetical protein [Gemmatimonadota bacterium]